MEDNMRIMVLDVTIPADTDPTVLPKDFPIEKGFNLITGICLINFGTHTKYNFSFSDHANNTRIYPADQSLFHPGNNGSEKFMPVTIPVTSTSMTVNTTIREKINQAISYQVVLQVEKR